MMSYCRRSTGSFDLHDSSSYRPHSDLGNGVYSVVAQISDPLEATHSRRNLSSLISKVYDEASFHGITDIIIIVIIIVE